MTARFVLPLLFLLLTPLACLACGATEVCADVESSLGGGVIWDGILISWSTDAETSDVVSYKVSRTTGEGWHPISLHWATDAVCTEALRSYVTIDPAGSGNTYRVDVLDGTQSVICSYQISVP